MLKSRFTALLVLLMTVTPVIGQSIANVKLKNRSAEELIPIIKPMLNPQDGISGNGYDLFIKTDHRTLANIRQLIGKLDTAPAQLLISMRSSFDVSQNNKDIAIHGNIGNDRIQLKSGNSSAGTQVHIRSEQHTTTERSTPQIRATEGQPALIQSGTAVPIRNTIRQRQNGRLLENEVTQFQPVTSGFYVTARLNGDNVTLEIDHNREQYRADGAITTSSVATRVTGKLGEWIAVSQTPQRSKFSGSQLSSRRKASTHERDTVYIKVEKLAQ